MTLLRPGLNEIYVPIEDDLRSFSDLLKKELSSEDVLINDIHQHLLKMTGKFLRPALTMLCSRVGGKSSDKAVRLAAAIELIHTATLVHDDIIDDSQFRRNQPSVYSKWGAEISIVSGDYLYAKAFVMLSSIGDPWVNQAFAACAHVICEGEMKQIEKRNDFLMDESQYLRIIHQKTAALFQAACMGGAYFSDAGERVVKHLGDYGYRIGMAFQIVDDCLDLMGETEEIGKTAGLDVYKNDVSLPLLYLFHALSETERARLSARIKEADPSLFKDVRKLAAEKRTVDKAMAKAREFAEAAAADLEAVAPSVYRDSLHQLALHCTERAR